ncbi:hypothetical protein JKF63_02777 [Porcisia hertigi]|uniref:Uncharacterized protein n=1 Tax=Porcisia hertigi TaxID=2761500 RepID=A0A836IIK9_9TRYP|nr:hypothetical protein JKF63_02777 [Porcisia hertigi]
MSEFLCGAEHPGAAMPYALFSSHRKRCREETHTIEACSRRTPPHVRVLVACENTTALVSLRGHVLDAYGHFNSAEFPGLVFFYNPVVASVDSGAVTLSLCDSASITELILKQNWKTPCPVHGPFRCACNVMHKVADKVSQLLSETFCQHLPFDVSIDCQRLYPHIHIDSQTKTWSLSLVGLPLPQKMLGPFPLGAVASPQSVKKYWFEYTEKSKVVDNACIMCAVSTMTQCTRCLCPLCQCCGVICSACERYVCHGCSAACESGMTICYHCPRLE